MNQIQNRITEIYDNLQNHEDNYFQQFTQGRLNQDILKNETEAFQQYDRKKTFF
jgi:hypothetical protein